jgi:hypothetical protein
MHSRILGYITAYYCNRSGRHTGFFIVDYPYKHTGIGFQLCLGSKVIGMSIHKKIQTEGHPELDYDYHEDNACE